MKVAIGSINPAKISAVKSAFKAVWPDKKFIFVAMDINSGVSKQPMSESETIKGARNRAKRSIKKLKADFGVGLEGGLEKVGNKWFDCGWIVVVDKRGKEGIGCSIRMESPKKMLAFIKKGLELGEIDDIVFKKKNSKHKEGHFGLMTNKAVVRSDAYKQAVISALVRFINPQLF